MIVEIRSTIYKHFCVENTMNTYPCLFRGGALIRELLLQLSLVLFKSGQISLRTSNNSRVSLSMGTVD